MSGHPPLTCATAHPDETAGTTSSCAHARPVTTRFSGHEPCVSPGAIAMRDALAAMSARNWATGDIYFRALPILALGSLSDLRALAESGNPRAQSIMGRAFLHAALGATLDHAQAIEWYRRAAAAGDPVAQYELAREYYYAETEHHGVTRNCPEAAQLYAAAAAEGHLSAQGELGVLLYLGDSEIPQNQTAGLMWLRRAAAAGNQIARGFLTQHNLPLQ